MSHYGCPEENDFLYSTSQGLSIANMLKGKNEISEFIFLGPGVLLRDGSRTEGKPVDMNNYRNRVFLKACDRAKIRRRRFQDTSHTFASFEAGHFFVAFLSSENSRLSGLDRFGSLEAKKSLSDPRRDERLASASMMGR